MLFVHQVAALQFKKGHAGLVERRSRLPNMGFLPKIIKVD
jgi:hypothetical protein